MTDQDPTDRPPPILASGHLDPTGELTDAGNPRYRWRPWRNNAEMIADVLGLLVPDRPALVDADVTYGRGKWWTIAGAPKLRHGLDVDGTGEFDDGVDFRELPYRDAVLDLVAFDPPFCATGGKATNADVANMRAGYGIGSDYSPDLTPRDVQDTIDRGLAEIDRVARPGGLLLVKCQNYISGGDLWPGAFLTAHAAARLDLELVADCTFVRPSGGPQPTRNRDGSPREQRTPRNNTSTLYVFRSTSGLEELDDVNAVRSDLGLEPHPITSRRRGRR